MFKMFLFWQVKINQKTVWEVVKLHWICIGLVWKRNMDPSKREQAIDLKIKLLREKNQQIEQRHKLIEEDKKLISYFF